VSIVAIDTGEPSRVFESPKDVVYALSASPDGKVLVAGGGDRLARVWSLADGTLLKTLHGHAGWVLDVSFSPDGTLLVTSSADRSAWVWDTATWESTVRFLEGDAVQGAVVVADGRNVVLAVGGQAQRSLKLRRRDNLRVNRTFSTHGGIPRRLVAGGRTRRMYVPCSDGVIRVYEQNGRIVQSLTGHQDWVQCVALNPQETTLASGCSDGTVKVWNLGSGVAVATLCQLAPLTHEWLIVTSQGYYTASPSAGVRWRSEDGSAPESKATDGLRDAARVRSALTKMASPARGGGRNPARRGSSPRAKDRTPKNRKSQKS
jgi:WD40 repeat protein